MEAGPVAGDLVPEAILRVHFLPTIINASFTLKFNCNIKLIPVHMQHISDGHTY